jgi:hypothetical protein
MKLPLMRVREIKREIREREIKRERERERGEREIKRKISNHHHVCFGNACGNTVNANKAI